MFFAHKNGFYKSIPKKPKPLRSFTNFSIYRSPVSDQENPMRSKT